MKLDDPKTWELLQDGKTTGVFQCESPLVKKWLRKIKPCNLWQLAAVISLVRPGPLLSGMADMYVKNKNNPDKMESFGNDIVDGLLRSTYGIISYQEQLIQIGQSLAWPHLEENKKLIKGDELRKAVSKKDQSKVLKIGKDFIEGCLHNNVSQELADRLFDLIKKSGRYAFNLSHAMSYAYVAYETAYLKANHPLEFFTVIANYSKESQDPSEYLEDIIQDAKAFGFNILLPNINKKNKSFVIEGDTSIRYGLGFIKYAGDSMTSLLSQLPLIHSWQQFIRYALDETSIIKIRGGLAEGLICSGALSDIKIPRQQFLQSYQTLLCLSKKELKYALQKIDAILINQLPDLLLDISQNVSTKHRKQIIESESIFLKENLKNSDSSEWIEEQEIKYLSCPISPTATQPFEHFSTLNCYECNQLSSEEDIKAIILIGRICDVYRNTVKTGKNKGRDMARLSIRDSTGRLSDLVIFSDAYDKFAENIAEKNIVQVHMNHPPGRGFYVNSVVPING